MIPLHASALVAVLNILAQAGLFGDSGGFILIDLAAVLHCLAILLAGHYATPTTVAWIVAVAAVSVLVALFLVWALLGSAVAAAVLVAVTGTCSCIYIRVVYM